MQLVLMIQWHMGKLLQKCISSVNYDGAIELHEALAGAEPGITHFVAVRDKGFASWIGQRKKSLSLRLFKNFYLTRKITNTNLTEVYTNYLLVQYNID